MDFIIRHKTIVAFAGFTLFCLVSLTMSTSTAVFTIEGLGSLFVMPFQKGYDGLQGGVQKFWAGFTELGDVRDELQRTRQKLMRYEAIAEELGEIKKENQLLRNLLNLADKITYESIPAVVISKDPDNWFRTIVLNRGSSSGVKVNMPVVAYQGEHKAVIGKVIEVRRWVSRVLPILAPEMKLGVMLQETRFPGLLKGYSSNSNLCIMDYISRAVPVKFGDVVITSGQGGIFPAGLLVGKVINAEIMEASAYQRAVVSPIIDYHRIEEVFIIKKEPDVEFLELIKEAEE